MLPASHNLPTIAFILTCKLSSCNNLQKGCFQLNFLIDYPPQLFSEVLHFLLVQWYYIKNFSSFRLYSIHVLYFPIPYFHLTAEPVIVSSSSFMIDTYVSFSSGASIKVCYVLSQQW